VILISDIPRISSVTFSVGPMLNKTIWLIVLVQISLVKADEKKKKKNNKKKTLTKQKN
jgi:hypothetical protein